jgi:hypothetical protein
MFVTMFTRGLTLAAAVACATFALEGSAAAASKQTAYFKTKAIKQASQLMAPPGEPVALVANSCQILSSKALTGTTWSNYFPVGSGIKSTGTIQHRGREVKYFSGVINDMDAYVVGSNCDDLRDAWIYGLLEVLEADVRKQALAKKIPGIVACTWPADGVAPAPDKVVDTSGGCSLGVTYKSSECPDLKQHPFRRVKGYTEIAKVAQVTDTSVTLNVGAKCEAAKLGVEEAAKAAQEKERLAAEMAGKCQEAAAKFEKQGFLTDSASTSTPSGCPSAECCTKPVPIKVGQYDCGTVRYKTKKKDDKGRSCH